MDIQELLEKKIVWSKGSVDDALAVASSHFVKYKDGLGVDNLMDYVVAASEFRNQYVDFSLNTAELREDAQIGYKISDGKRDLFIDKNGRIRSFRATSAEQSNAPSSNFLTQNSFEPRVRSEYNSDGVLDPELLVFDLELILSNQLVYTAKGLERLKAYGINNLVKFIADDIEETGFDWLGTNDAEVITALYEASEYIPLSKYLPNNGRGLDKNVLAKAVWRAVNDMYFFDEVAEYLNCDLTTIKKYYALGEKLFVDQSLIQRYKDAVIVPVHPRPAIYG